MHDQSLEQVAYDIGFVDGRGLVRIDRLRFGGAASVVDGLGKGRRQERACSKGHGRGDQRRLQHIFQHHEVSPCGAAQRLAPFEC